MIPSNSKWWQQIALVLIGVVAGLFLFEVLHEREPGHPHRPPPNHDFDLREGSVSGLNFVNPLLACDDFTSLNDKTTETAKKEIKNYLDSQKNKGAIGAAAVYFRDLNNGPWFSVGGDTKFWPASLLKVPILLAVYKHTASDRDFLSRKVTYDAELSVPALDINSGPAIEAKHTYTVKELLERMIMYSDNYATALLRKQISPSEEADIYDQLGIEPPDAVGYALTVQKYATFFRVLYNATLLPAAESNEALALLSRANFGSGLVAGLPQGMTVAHKFGERANDTDGSKQLHDCGIVYFPGSPYLLCVMTRGTDFEKLGDTIANVSRIIYERVLVDGNDFAASNGSRPR